MSAVPSLLSLAVPIVSKNLSQGVYSKVDFLLNEKLGTLVYDHYQQKYSVDSQEKADEIAQKLRLNGMKLDLASDFDVTIATKQTNLERLQLDFTGPDREEELFTVNMAKGIPSKSRETVKTLSLRSKTMDWILRMSNMFPNVTNLDVSRRNTFTKTDMSNVVKNFPHLKILNVSQIEDLSLEGVNQLRNLEVLIISDVVVCCPRGLRDMLYLPNLQVLDMSEIIINGSTDNVKMLDLVLRSLESTGLQFLPKLKTIFAIHTQITRNILETFCRHFRSLKSIKVVGSFECFFDDIIGNVEITGCGSLDACAKELDDSCDLDSALTVEQVLFTLLSEHIDEIKTMRDMQRRVRFVATISRVIAKFSDHRLNSKCTMLLLHAFGDTTMEHMDLAAIRKLCRAFFAIYKKPAQPFKHELLAIFWHIFNNIRFFDHLNSMDIKSLVSAGLALLRTDQDIYVQDICDTLFKLLRHQDYTDAKIGVDNIYGFVDALLGKSRTRMQRLEKYLRRMVVIAQGVRRSTVIRENFLKSNVMSEWAAMRGDPNVSELLFVRCNEIITMAAFISKNSIHMRNFLKEDVRKAYFETPLPNKEFINRDEFSVFALKVIIANSQCSASLDRDFISRINALRSTLKPDTELASFFEENEQWRIVSNYVLTPASIEPVSTEPMSTEPESKRRRHC